MDNQLVNRSKILLAVVIALTLLYSYFVLQESAVVPGIDTGTDELKEKAVSTAQKESVIEGKILDCAGNVITEGNVTVSASDFVSQSNTVSPSNTAPKNIKMDYCYYPSFSYLVGYNNATESFGLRGKYQNQLHTGVVGERGATMTLTVRADVQDKAASILSASGLSGSIIVMDRNTGRIIALASRRGVDFDVNHLHDRYSLYSSQDSFFCAPGYKDSEPPGSTFKLVTTAAMLEHGMADRTYVDTGTAEFDGVEVHNYTSVPFGEIGLQEALSESVNTYFATMAVEMGADALEQKAHDFLIGQDIELDFTTLKSKIDFQDGNKPVVAKNGFGQGIGADTLRMTPLHIAMVAQSIADDGVMRKPWLIDNITLEEKDPGSGEIKKKILYKGSAEDLTQTMKPKIASELRDMMHETAVNKYGFTKEEFGYICAKTGTAELNETYDHIYIVTFSDSRGDDSSGKDDSTGNYVVMCSANNTHGLFGSNLKDWAKEMYRYLAEHPYYYREK